MDYLRRFFISLIITCLALGIASSSAFAQSGVTIDVDQFGVGSMFRPGDITGIRLKLTSNLTKATEMWVQWEVPNADGDIAEYGRTITLTPSVATATWLYAPLSPEVTSSTPWTVRVFEQDNGVRKSEVGGTRISPLISQLADPGCSMIAVVGERRVGLDGFGVPNQIRASRPIGAHEDTRIASGIKPTQLPDRWFGLMPFEAVVWAGDNVSPQDLGVDQADALREYIRHGGHLVIVLPTEGTQWGLGAAGQTLIEDLLPCRKPGVIPRKDDAVMLESLLPVLTKYNRMQSLNLSRDPPEFSVRVFKDLKGSFDVIDNHFEPLISLPDGRVIAIQRLFGHGRVTVIGINLADGRLAALGPLPGFPQADAFWNRVLGRRADTPNTTELTILESKNRLARGGGEITHDNNLGSGQLITSQINMEGEAGVGLLLAIVIFAAYWLLAGPLGFGLLKHYGKSRHAWVAFAVCAAAFTALAWGAMGALHKPMKIKHVTFLDHIARPPDDPRSEEPQYQRAVSFFTVYLPNYSPTKIAIAPSPNQRNILASWAPPPGPQQHFPNVDQYRVDVAQSPPRDRSGAIDTELHPMEFSMPSRSTATQLYANWMGGLDEKWGGMLRVDPANPITVVKEGDRETALQGRIINELPGTLTDVTVIWVQSNRFMRRSYAQEKVQDRNQDAAWVGNSGQALNSTSVWRPGTEPPWKSGLPFDLVDLKQLPTVNMAKWIRDRYIVKYTPSGALGPPGVDQLRDADKLNYMEMLGIFQQLNPPEYLRTTGEMVETVAFHRELGRELDLSPWFSRPCLIIIGYLLDSECPVPLRIDKDNESPPSVGTTIVRWVYPLRLDEKAAFKEVFPEKDDGK